MNAPRATALLCILMLAACQPAVLISTNSPAPTNRAAPALPTDLPSATPLPSVTPTLPSLAWPTYTAPTLAPFPVSAQDLSTSLPAADAFVPVARSEHDHFYFSRPVRSVDLKFLVPNSRYGAVQIGTAQDAHLGIDFSVNTGTAVLAAAEGTVIWADYGLLYNSIYYLDDPYGISVVIRHDFGYEGERLYTLYAHLSEAKVEVGERVESGEVIALSGNTGLSTGPHLHFEIRLGQNTIYYTRNPELWIAPPEGSGVLVGFISTSKNFLVKNKLVEITSLDTGQRWNVYTYATDYTLQPDGYYKENFAIGDLPAGRYEIAIPYVSEWRRVEVEVTSGAVTYFHFQGLDGYFFDLPAQPSLGYLPD